MLKINNNNKYNRHYKIKTMLLIKKKKETFNFQVSLHPFYCAKL